MAAGWQVGSGQLCSHAHEEILPAQGAWKVHLSTVGHPVTHDADVAREPCMGIENSFTDMHMPSVAMVWCLQLGGEHMLLGFLQLAMGEAVDAVECLLADQLAQYHEWQSGPWLACLHALGTDVGDEPLQVVMLSSQPPVVTAELCQLSLREPAKTVMCAAGPSGRQ